MKPLAKALASTFKISTTTVCPSLPSGKFHIALRDQVEYYCNYGHPEVSIQPDTPVENATIYGGLLLFLLAPFLKKTAFRCHVCGTVQWVFFYSTIWGGFAIRDRAVFSVKDGCTFDPLQELSHTLSQHCTCGNADQVADAQYWEEKGSEWVNLGSWRQIGISYQCTACKVIASLSVTEHDGKLRACFASINHRNTNSHTDDEDEKGADHATE